MENSAEWDQTRRSCGAIVSLAERINLARPEPRPDLASSAYCLAASGTEYVVLSPDGAAVTVLSLRSGRTYRAEWLTLTSASPVGQETLTATQTARAFQPPSGNLILHLRPTSDATTPPAAEH